MTFAAAPAAEINLVGAVCVAWPLAQWLVTCNRLIMGLVTALPLLCGECLAATAESSAASLRTEFLAQIDRPRVALAVKVIVRERAAGLITERFSFSTD